MAATAEKERREGTSVVSHLLRVLVKASESTRATTGAARIGGGPWVHLDAQPKARSDGETGLLIADVALLTGPVTARWHQCRFRIRDGWAVHYMASVTDVAPTSNKHDLSDLIRDLRAQNADVWVFNPQEVAREASTWWWNPLSYVTDSERAAEMATNFATGSRPAGAKMGEPTSTPPARTYWPDCCSPPPPVGSPSSACTTG